DLRLNLGNEATVPELPGERIGAKLNSHGLRTIGDAAFEVKVGSAAVGRPERFALPSGIRIVDAAIDILGEEAHRIGNGSIDELPVDQPEYRTVEIANGDR